MQTLRSLLMLSIVLCGQALAADVALAISPWTTEQARDGNSAP